MALSVLCNIVAAPSLKASKVIQDLTYTAVTAGSNGNNITVRYVDPGANSQTISVSVASNAITVNLATDSGGLLTSTAAQIKTAVDASSPAHALVTVAISGTGSTVEIAQSATALAGGFNTAITVPAQQPVSIQLAITNSGGSPVTIDAIYPRISAPTPAPSFSISNPILPQPISIGAGVTSFVLFQFLVNGSESGLYTVNADVCSSASSLLVEASIPANITL